jgi:hypothetical protein
MSAEGRLQNQNNVSGPVYALLMQVSAAGVPVNAWWNGGTAFVADGTLVVAGGNTLTAYQGSLLTEWLADLPANLPVAYYRFHFWLGTPGLSNYQDYLGYADWQGKNPTLLAGTPQASPGTIGSANLSATTFTLSSGSLRIGQCGSFTGNVTSALAGIGWVVTGVAAGVYTIAAIPGQAALSVSPASGDTIVASNAGTAMPSDVDISLNFTGVAG